LVQTPAGQSLRPDTVDPANWGCSQDGWLSAGHFVAFAATVEIVLGRDCSRAVSFIELKALDAIAQIFME
jgi:hypothetical protein